jgi:Fe-S-cluster containining protein
MKKRPYLPAEAAEERRAALAEVRAIYAELENRPIARNCTRLTECCRFRLTGRTPQLTRGEALLAAQAVRASGRREMPEPVEGACPLLREDGRCLIYQDRPFGCRSHFCAAAGGPYARSEVLDLIRRLEALDARLGGSGPRGLPGAVGDELRAMG